MIAATVFSLTRQPASRRSAVIRGEPYVPRCAANNRRIADRQLLAAGLLRRGVPVAPLVEPRRADPQRPARHRVRDLVLDPLGRDEPGHRYRPIASSTQRATERLRTSRCIRSSMFSLRSRANSARSSSLSAALPPSRPGDLGHTSCPACPR